MINVGLDFGSTQTVISFYNFETGRPEVMQCGTKGFIFPSYVAYNKSKDKYEYGNTARQRLGNDKYKVFRAFKMLLRERDPKVLAEWNYDSENTPEKIAGLFIKYCLKTALKNGGYSEDAIDTLIVGIPEIWRKPGQENSKNANQIILSICKELNIAKKVKLVTEPEAAAAYFAYRYINGSENKEQECFNGHVLVVDYGGGTLDITLSQVLQNNDPANRTMYDMRIVTLERTGEGENTVNQESGTVKVGNAGLRYQEAVMDLALEEAGYDPDAVKTEKFDKYSKLLHEFEMFLIDSDDDDEEGSLEEVFSDFEEIGIYEPESLEELDEEEYNTFEFCGDSVEVTYGMLAKAYKAVIYDTLEHEIQYILDYMKQEKIAYQRGNSKNFQLALVGGFGNFYLVKQQIKKLLGEGLKSEIIKGANECEKAISFGTALYASDIVGHTFTAPYGLGMRLKDWKNDAYDCYAFSYREVIDPHKVYTIDIYKTPITMNVKEFRFNEFIQKDGRGQEGKAPAQRRLKKEYIDKLKNILEGEVAYFHLGFSMDENDVITIHIIGYDQEKHVPTGYHNKVELTSLDCLFLPTEA